MSWVEFDRPVQFRDFTHKLYPGQKIRVRETLGLASAPYEYEDVYTVGDINDLGGRCDCCPVAGNALVVAEYIPEGPGEKE